MSESQSKSFTFMLSAIPLCLLILVDSFALFLQGQPKAISHLSLAVLATQLLCVLVFHKGQICNGQRGRLVKVNGYLFVYWGFWLLLSLFSNYHYVLTDMVSLCGIGLSLAIWFQPTDTQLRQSILLLGALLGGLGVIVYSLIFLQLPWLALLPYNFFGQLFMGVILANLFLVIAKNRLQGFIALLPLVMMIFLLLNGILSTVLIYLAHQSAVVFSNEFALGLYFFLHLVLVAIIALPILTKTKLSYPTLSLLFFIALSLPIWANFSLIAR
ncbi:hypothetical protein [Avibacterium endocarditidis]|uniref:hypothetical protein n=1 Tax=Avibacterium endocarditidis TaxID=380674 RepID=UPI0039EF226A